MAFVIAALVPIAAGNGRIAKSALGPLDGIARGFYGLAGGIHHIDFKVMAFIQLEVNFL